MTIKWGVKMLKIEFDKVGIEREYNVYDVPYGNIVFLGLCKYTDAMVSENINIKEINVKPVRISNIRNTIRRFILYAKYTPQHHSEGLNDCTANSAHTHVSFKSENDFKKYLNILTGTDYQEKLLMVLSRAGLWNEQTFRHAFTYRARPFVRNEISFSDKGYWISKNSPGCDTIEFRINEAVIPFWVYLLPVIDEIPSSYAYDISILIENVKDEIGDYDDDVLSEKFSECYYNLISDFQYLCLDWLESNNVEQIKESAKLYWSNKISSMNLLSEILDLMIEFKLDMFKVFKKIENKSIFYNCGEVKECIEKYNKYIYMSRDDVMEMESWSNDSNIINRLCDGDMVDFIYCW